MGLDVGLGIVVLLAGIRGWFRGFAFQAVQLVCLIGSIYVASPLRDLARPYAIQTFPSVEQPILDKILWWSAVVLSYVVTSGAGYSMVRFHRRRAFADLEPNRGDQGAGFALGALKGAIVVAFVASSLAARTQTYIQSGGWAGQQVQDSRALMLAMQHKPAEKIWQSAPIQALVTQIRREGLGDLAPVAPEPDKSRDVARPTAADTPPIQTARRPGRLSLPPPPVDPRSDRFIDDFDRTLRQEGLTPDHPEQ